jgi:hypothetical protein
MRDGDFFEDDTSKCADDAFSGPLCALGTAQVDALFRTRAAHFPGMAENTFLALVEAVLKPFDELLSPEQFEELRGWVSLTQDELAQGCDPAAGDETGKHQVNPLRGRPRKARPRSPGPVRSRKSRPR